MNCKNVVDAMVIITMRKRSKLLEHVVNRIIKRILQEHKLVDIARVEVAKINPPINGDVEEVSVLREVKRE